MGGARLALSANSILYLQFGANGFSDIMSNRGEVLPPPALHFNVDLFRRSLQTGPQRHPDSPPSAQLH